MYPQSPPVFMLDSGAFSVWNRGETINVDDYIDFCLQYPNCSNYVNLDIIPGKPDGKVPSPEEGEAACQGGWDNYQKMLKRLPFDKVIPVFHQGDDFKWLKKYMEFGTPYIGISPNNSSMTNVKARWLKQVAKHILDEEGKLKIRTHGFAVTSYRLMKMMPWYSVDSASWVRHSAYGTIYVPLKRDGVWRYDIAPFQLNVSPKSPSRDERGKHITTLTPGLKSQVKEYLKHMGIPIGKFEVVDVEEGYKRAKKGELWYEKGKKDKILRTVKSGLMTCHQRRFWMNMKFLHEANDQLETVEHIYFAGAGGSLDDHIEYKTKRRLMSYHEIINSKGAREAFERHMTEVMV